MMNKKMNWLNLEAVVEIEKQGKLNYKKFQDNNYQELINSLSCIINLAKKSKVNNVQLCPNIIS